MRTIALHKVVARSKIRRVLDRERRAGRHIVFTNGCFDLLHAGHVKLLQKARSLGDVLVVGLNSDSSVRRLKGAGRPLAPAADRAIVLGALACVDYVVTFGEDTPLNLIRQVRPDVLVKGGDYKLNEIVGAEFVRQRGGTVRRFRLVPGRSTSTLMRRIREL